MSSTLWALATIRPPVHNGVLRSGCPNDSTFECSFCDQNSAYLYSLFGKESLYVFLIRLTNAEESALLIKKCRAEDAPKRCTYTQLYPSRMRYQKQPYLTPPELMKNPGGQAGCYSTQHSPLHYQESP
ncbi:MAG: hypothetical protein CSA33_06570 [Desulfobulbus propionicus]|nr:MAG: hypothetical protein CSA33_06570 [Desulfobulbus propionicus]